MKHNTRTYITFLLWCAVIAMLIYMGAYYFLAIKGLVLYYSATQIALYYGSTSALMLTLIYIANRKAYRYTAFAFMWAIFFRFITVIIAILPLAKAKVALPFYEAFFNIIPSFLYICLEAVFAIQLLKNNKLED
ncbi:hypothetical protein [Capnocytophaga sp. oral taxon 878]|uniref:hypothetical protein n=1 Tax=Capnocytophaga sp. oral taxon 878 TaxID=1316596 RepID=UPI000D040B53|nr:hypothetical protein [Capnocytophaga sp. oral taxon 878]AVM51302.1 hypothetical protein C4H12_12985 [Capnocytophaga sp. oral taxon 878]